MNVKILLSLLLVFSGFVMLLVRDKPNPFIGIRFGYTYFSKEAWRKANTFAGLYCIILGLCFLVIGIGLPFKIFLGIYVITITSVVYLSYRIAKETYEKEDLSTPVEEFKPMRVSLRDALILEVIPIILYVLAVAVLWNRIPETVAIHFGINFKPDTYASKPVGVLLIPLTAMFLVTASTVLARREPLLLRYPPNILVVLQSFLAIDFFANFLYNASLISEIAVIATIFASIIVLIATIVLKYKILR